MNKEQAYDAKINPLMAEIIKICTEHKIAMVASFAIPIEGDPSLEVTTSLLDENGRQPDCYMRFVREVYGRGREFAPGTIVVEREDGTKVIETVYP